MAKQFKVAPKGGYKKVAENVAFYSNKKVLSANESVIQRLFQTSSGLFSRPYITAAGSFKIGASREEEKENE